MTDKSLIPDEEPVPPKWREDFPFESEGDDYISRRDFTRFLCVVSAGLATGNGWVLWKSLHRKTVATQTVEICKTTDLQPGKWRVFNYPDEKTPAILVRRLNGEFTAFLQQCTHLSCPVAYEANRDGKGEAISCHCHNGCFDIDTGRGVSGPPRELRPLPRIEIRVADGKVAAVGFAASGEKKS